MGWLNCRPAFFLRPISQIAVCLADYRLNYPRWIYGSRAGVGAFLAWCIIVSEQLPVHFMGALLVGFAAFTAWAIIRTAYPTAAIIQLMMVYGRSREAQAPVSNVSNFGVLTLLG